MDHSGLLAPRFVQQGQWAPDTAATSRQVEAPRRRSRRGSGESRGRRLGEPGALSRKEFRFSRNPNADNPRDSGSAALASCRLSPSRWADRWCGSARGSAGLSRAGILSRCSAGARFPPRARNRPRRLPAPLMRRTGPTRRDEADYGGGDGAGDKWASERREAKSGNPCESGSDRAFPRI